MTSRALNLLHYPRQWPIGDAASVRLGLICALLGGGLALLALSWARQQVPGWQYMLSDARQQAKARNAQQAQAQQMRALHARWQQENARNQRWQQTREDLQRLELALGQEAQRSGLRLAEWHGEGTHLRLQGWLPSPDALPGLQMRLAQVWPAAWQLHSLAQETGGWRIALQSQMLTASAAGAAPAAAMVPSSTPPDAR